MRSIYIGRHGDQHFIIRKRNLFNNFISRGFKHHLSRGDVARDLLFGIIPFVANCYRLNGINVIQSRLICLIIALGGACWKQTAYSKKENKV